jgi:peroxiredoxin
MKTIVFTFLVSLLFISVVFGQSGSDSKAFLLVGKIIGKDSGRITIWYEVDKSYVSDTLDVKNGTFYFDGKISEPTYVLIMEPGPRLSAPKKMVGMYIEPGVMKLTLYEDHFKDFELIGSQTQKDQNEYFVLQKYLGGLVDSLHSQLIALNPTFKQVVDEQINKKMWVVSDKLDSARSEMHLGDISFISNHPKSFVSLKLLDYPGLTDQLSLDLMKKFYSRLDTIIKKSENGQKLQRDIRNRERSAVGAIAPDFKTTNANNDTIKLSDFRTKNDLLLYFWSLGNKPSRAAFSHIKDVYQKYHSKGLEVICIGAVFLRDKWIEVIRKDSLESFHHVFSRGLFQLGDTTDILHKYSVEGYSWDLHILPVQILIDKTGKIVGRWQDDMESMDKRLTEIFK